MRVRSFSILTCFTCSFGYLLMQTFQGFLPVVQRFGAQLLLLSLNFKPSRLELSVRNGWESGAAAWRCLSAGGPAQRLYKSRVASPTCRGTSASCSGGCASWWWECVRRHSSRHIKGGRASCDSACASSCKAWGWFKTSALPVSRLERSHQFVWTCQKFQKQGHVRGILCSHDAKGVGWTVFVWRSFCPCSLARLRTEPASSTELPPTVKEFQKWLLDLPRYTCMPYMFPDVLVGRHSKFMDVTAQHLRFTVKSESSSRKFTCSDFGDMDMAKRAALLFDNKIKHAISQFHIRKGQARFCFYFFISIALTCAILHIP